MSDYKLTLTSPDGKTSTAAILNPDRLAELPEIAGIYVSALLRDLRRQEGAKTSTAKNS